MLRFPAKRRSRPTIHLTALIDIVFLLLIFFLLASQFVGREGVAIIVPQIENPGAQLPMDVIISIDESGLVSVDDAALDEHQLRRVLQVQLGKAQSDTVIIQADRRVQYDIVVKTIDVAKSAGAQNILLVAQRKNALPQ